MEDAKPLKIVEKQTHFVLSGLELGQQNLEDANIFADEVVEKLKKPKNYPDDTDDTIAQFSTNSSLEAGSQYDILEENILRSVVEKSKNEGIQVVGIHDITSKSQKDGALRATAFRSREYKIKPSKPDCAIMFTREEDGRHTLKTIPLNEYVMEYQYI